MLDKLLPFIFIFTSVCGCSLFDKIADRPDLNTSKTDLTNQIKGVDCDNADRLREVENLFRRVGAKDSEIVTEKYENVSNVVVTVKGKTEETVVVGAHFDKTTLGCGVIDNWTGVVILANLYRNVKAGANDKTYKFVAFGKEEEGLIGSKALVDDIPNREVSNYCAMVNFDSFGFTETWTLETISDSSLINLAKEIAAARGETFAVMNFSGASSDSKSFRRKNIPAITLSGLDDNWREYLHQDKDQLEHINFDKVYGNLEFSFQYLKAIDGKPCGYFR
jgi:Zn-dependent M28 family amino/carboxypeptidase